MFSMVSVVLPGSATESLDDLDPASVLAHPMLADTKPAIINAAMDGCCMARSIWWQCQLSNWPGNGVCFTASASICN
ncbi:MAG: hypothetical protein DI635_05725 [Pseudoxanthomonas suwonensis]|nr:MAG: hypothetical protein DI635_05725 [Pseudoxanthomonas suwonensis]